MSLLTKINVTDLPNNTARGFKAIGIIGTIETREISNGYTQVVVPLSYRRNPTDTEDRQFTARFNLRPEWLTPEFKQRVKQGQVTGTEQIQYNINVGGLLRGLFESAGITTGEVEFTALSGKLIGFKTKPQRNDPSRLEVSFFFRPKVQQ